MDEREYSLEEIFANLREELEKVDNPPNSFTSKQFQEDQGCGKTAALNHLKYLESKGIIRAIDKMTIKDKNGNNQTVKGWQWIAKESD